MSYTPPTREQIHGALFALVPGISWDGGQTFQFTSRRVKLWGDVPVQPALCQAEHGEIVNQVTRLPYTRKMSASWLIYHAAGRDEDAVPAATNNEILDAIETALQPAPADPGFQDGRLTLGGLVHHCFIDGKVFKDPGDLDGQALMVVPITILAP